MCSRALSARVATFTTRSLGEGDSLAEEVRRRNVAAASRMSPSRGLCVLLARPLVKKENLAFPLREANLLADKPLCQAVYLRPLWKACEKTKTAQAQQQQRYQPLQTQLQVHGSCCRLMARQDKGAWTFQGQNYTP